MNIEDECQQINNNSNNEQLPSQQSLETNQKIPQSPQIAAEVAEIEVEVTPVSGSATASTTPAPTSVRETRRKQNPPSNKTITNRNPVKPARPQVQQQKEKVVDEAERDEKNIKSEKCYSDLVRSLGALKRFDWIDTSNPLIKAPPIKSLTPSVFWFMVCSEFFPRQLSIAQEPVAVLSETLSKIERQPIQQLIRIKEMGHSSTKQESASEIEEAQKLVSAIRKLRFEKPSANIRNSAELKDDYTTEDDLYIMSMRYDLLDLYRKVMATTSTPPNNTQPLQTYDPEKALRSMKRLDIEDLLITFNNELAEQTSQIREMVDKTKKNIEADVAREKIIFSAKDLNFQDALVDIHYFNQIEIEYLNFLENKQQSLDILALNGPNSSSNSNQNNSSAPPTSAQHSKQMVKVKEPVVMEDLACQVCNDGDYTDDDLIVFCSKCNVSVHQRCYGIPKIPIDDWICELCLTFGPQGKYLRCILCSQRGGAMKPSRIPITSNLLSQLNVNYAEFAACCSTQQVGKSLNKKQRYNEEQKPPNPDHHQQQHLHKSEAKENRMDDEEEEEQEEEEENNQYYDFHTLKPFTAEEVKQEPSPNFVWSHICCALWTPECFFDDKNYYTNVKGIENIDKSRFKLTCSICKTSDGSCVPCAKSKCEEAFHPECARRVQRFMEIRNGDKLDYLIYCEGHTPLKLRRQLEQKEKKYKEEIISFCRIVEKTREILKKELPKALAQTNGGVASGGNTAAGSSANSAAASGGLSALNTAMPGKVQSKKAFISIKKICQQYTKTQAGNKKEEKEFLLAFVTKLIAFIESQVIELQSKSEDQTKTDKEKKKERSSNLLKINTWTATILKDKQSQFWSEAFFNNEPPVSSYKRFKKIFKDIEKKKEFRNLYFKTLQSSKGIRPVSKEEKLREKEKKKTEKLLRKQARAQEQLKREQEKITKKELLQIRRTSKKEEKIKKKQKEKIKVAPIEEVPYQQEEITEEQDQQLYCVCRRKYIEGEIMMACEKCDEWYHLECIGFLGTMEEAETLDFVCKFCDIKEASAELSQERKTRYGHFFARYEDENYDAFKSVLIEKELQMTQQLQLQQQQQQLISQKQQKKSHKKIIKTPTKEESSKQSKKKTTTTTTTTTTKKSTSKKRKLQDAIPGSELHEDPISKKLCTLMEGEEEQIKEEIGNDKVEILNQEIIFDENQIDLKIEGSHSNFELKTNDDQQQLANQNGDSTLIDSQTNKLNQQQDSAIIVEEKVQLVAHDTIPSMIDERGQEDRVPADHSNSDDSLQGILMTNVSPKSISENEEKNGINISGGVEVPSQTQMMMDSSSTLVSVGAGAALLSPLSASVKTDPIKYEDKLKQRSLNDFFEKKTTPF